MIALTVVLMSLGVCFAILVYPYNAVIALVSLALSLLTGFLLWRRRRAALAPALVAAVIVCALAVAGWVFVLMPWANQPVVSPIETLGADGADAALIVYHPGRSDLQAQAVRGFADGLVEAGWRVDLTTASGETPTDLTGYRLLVLGAQSYTWTPAQPVQAYVRRLGDLAGLPVAAILSGLGETGPANDVMRDLVTAQGGRLIDIYNIWQLRPIDELYGIDDPYEAMRQTARSLTLPGADA
jgi:hypothetical protein